MPISNRNLPAGTILVATYKKAQHRVLVLEAENGPGYQLDEGTIYRSLSSAGSAVMGGVACNGWRFWSVEGDEPPPSDVLPIKAKKASARSGLLRQVRKVPNQRGMAEGQERWHCSACMQTFLVETGTMPESCPQGHAREVTDELAAPMA